MKANIEQNSYFNTCEIDIKLLTRCLLLLGYEATGAKNTESNRHSLIKVGVADSAKNLENTMFENIL